MIFSVLLELTPGIKDRKWIFVGWGSLTENAGKLKEEGSSWSHQDDWAGGVASWGEGGPTMALTRCKSTVEPLQSSRRGGRQSGMTTDVPDMAIKPMAWQIW